MAVISEFTDDGGAVDTNAWRRDIIGRLLIDMDNGLDGLTTRDLCMLYFGYADFEKKVWMGDQMQLVRQMLQDRQTPLILRSYGYRWYIVKPSDWVSARGFMLDRAKRWIRGYERLETVSEIVQGTYALPGNDPLVEAIEGTEPGVRRVERALTAPPEKPTDS